MADDKTLDDLITIREAAPGDVASMATIVPRAYAPDARLNTLFPDTPAVRRWWEQTYKAAIVDHHPACRLLVAVVRNSDGDGDGKDLVVGVLTMHLLTRRRPDASPDSSVPPEADTDAAVSGGGATSGVIFLVPLTPDHDPALEPARESMLRIREETMGTQAHYLIELLGVDSAYAGRGIGRRLVRRACDVADAAGAAIFLQTSQARRWWLGLGCGFESRKHDDPEGDSSSAMVRPAPAAAAVAATAATTAAAAATA
ncbi:hypothetical protein GGR56DRAFT_85004 [Xylariaceae sp. FL0804]|nr:hypothetical protein GGR56DRAFT_85004 [Xylariaceae sp. FL0804]